MNADTTSEVVERLARRLGSKPWMNAATPEQRALIAELDADAAALRALAAERDEANRVAAIYAADIGCVGEERDAARAECLTLASQVAEAQREAARMREALRFYTMPKEPPKDVLHTWALRMDRDRGGVAHAALEAALAEAPR